MPGAHARKLYKAAYPAICRFGYMLVYSLLCTQFNAFSEDLHVCLDEIYVRFDS